MTVEIDEAAAERLRWLAGSLAISPGVKVSPSELASAIVMLVERRALEAEFQHRAPAE